MKRGRVAALGLLVGLLTACNAASPPTPSPTASPSPTPSPSPTAAAVERPLSGALAAGTYYYEDMNVKRLTFTVPAGWSIPDFDAVVAKDGGTPTEVSLGAWVVSHIFTDACQWDEASVVDVGMTAAELDSALATQKSRTASAVTDTTVGGFPAKRIELTVSPTLDTATCTRGNLRYWPGAGRPMPDFSGGMCCNPTGNIDAIYAVDVAGKRLVIVARHYPSSTSQNVAELQSIVDSIQIEP
jgi:hypothetical protein